MKSVSPARTVGPAVDLDRRFALEHVEVLVLPGVQVVGRLAGPAGLPLGLDDEGIAPLDDRQGLGGESRNCVMPGSCQVAGGVRSLAGWP